MQESHPNRWLFCYNEFMDKGTITPLRDLLLIELDAKSDRTESGIYVSEAWETSPNTATVIKAGTDATIEAGTKLIINPYAVLDINGEKLLKFIKEADVLGTT